VKAGTDEKAARKWRSLGKMPGEVKVEHCWRTREVPFEEVWAGVEKKLRINPVLEAKTLFEDLQRGYPGDSVTGNFGPFSEGASSGEQLKDLLEEYTFLMGRKLGSYASRISPR
jgi:hypothetical protein